MIKKKNPEVLYILFLNRTGSLPLGTGLSSFESLNHLCFEPLDLRSNGFSCFPCFVLLFLCVFPCYCLLCSLVVLILWSIWVDVMWSLWGQIWILRLIRRSRFVLSEPILFCCLFLLFSVWTPYVLTAPPCLFEFFFLLTR